MPRNKIINKRVARKACEKFYRLQSPLLLHALVDFIQIYTPCEISEKYLTNPYKNLLYVLIGTNDVTQRDFIEIMNEVENGPLSGKWKEVINVVIDSQKTYEIQANFDSRDIPLVEIGDITFPDVSLDIQEEIKNLKGTVKEINKSILEQSKRNDHTFNSTMTSTSTRNPLVRQANVEKSFLDETLNPDGPDFKNVLSSTVDEDLNNAINIFWRVRDGNLQKLQKVSVPKMPPKDKYPIKHHFTVPEPVKRPIEGGKVNLDNLQAMLDELGVYKSSYERRIKDQRWPKKSKMRYPLIGIKN